MSAPEPANANSNATAQAGAAEALVDLKKKVVEDKPEEEKKGLTDDALTKYTTAGTILGEVLKKFLPSLVEGKGVIELCEEGDKLINDSVAGVWNKKGAKIAKGLAFPTCLSINNTVSHYSPLPSDPNVPSLKDGDVVKVMMGVHIDGYASVHSETIVVGASKDKPAGGAKADVVRAAYDAAQIAMRTVKPGAKNWEVTDAVQAVSKEFGCIPVQSMLSCRFEQGVIDGKDRIIINPSPEAKRDHQTCTFEEGQVWGVDVLVVSGDDGKARSEESRTSVYQKSSTVSYQLKMQTSRKVFSEINKKAGAFPFTLRSLEDEKRARMGVQEAAQHGLLQPYDVVYTGSGTVVAQFFFTMALLPAGPLLLSPLPSWYSADKLKTDKSLQNEDLKATLARPLRENKKKAKKAASKANGAEGEAAK